MLPQGFTASGVACGLKPSGSADLGMLVSDRPATAAGVFTRNRFAAAPVLVTKRALAGGTARAIVCNAGNANACTGPHGIADAERMVSLAAKALGYDDEVEVLPASTGVIGQRMNMEAVDRGIAAAVEALAPDGGDAFARAIMTTDTREKIAEARVGDATITGFAKGAGMMAPEMATMLAFIVTDAAVDRAVAADALRAGIDDTFNALNLDACMSTNDTVLLLANGASGNGTLARGDRAAAFFAAAVKEVCASLAHQIADDGEGMSKLVRVTVEGAIDRAEAREAAHAVAGSVLLRCALNGADPYWGRVLAALGASRIPFDPDRVDVWMGGEKLAENGTFGPGDADKARERLSERAVEIVVDLHRGSARSAVLTNDLSVEYVRFNTEYTT